MPPVYVEGTNEISSKVFFQETLAPNPPVQQVHLIPIMAISSHHPEPGVCPYCHQIIVTRIKKKNGLLVWLASAGICFLGFALGCCLIPWFLDGLKDTVHYCPNCNRMIGQKKRL